MVLDASVWVSLFSRRDERHRTTRQWHEALIGEGGTVEAPLLLLGEVAGALARRSGSRALAFSALGHLRRAPSLTLAPLDPVLASLAARLAIELRLRGTDAVYVALALREGVPLVTWDREQRERASAIIEARTPA